MDCSTPSFPAHHQFLELTQTHVHWIGDAIQPSHLCYCILKMRYWYILKVCMKNAYKYIHYKEQSQEIPWSLHLWAVLCSFLSCALLVSYSTGRIGSTSHREEPASPSPVGTLFGADINHLFPICYYRSPPPAGVCALLSSESCKKHSTHLIKEDQTPLTVEAPNLTRLSVHLSYFLPA